MDTVVRAMPNDDALLRSLALEFLRTTMMATAVVHDTAAATLSAQGIRFETAFKVSRVAVANVGLSGGLMCNDDLSEEWYAKVLVRFLNSGPDHQLSLELKYNDGSPCEQWLIRLNRVRFWDCVNVDVAGITGLVVALPTVPPSGSGSNSIQFVHGVGPLKRVNIKGMRERAPVPADGQLYIQAREAGGGCSYSAVAMHPSPATIVDADADDDTGTDLDDTTVQHDADGDGGDTDEENDEGEEGGNDRDDAAATPMESAEAPSVWPRAPIAEPLEGDRPQMLLLCLDAEAEPPAVIRKVGLKRVSKQTLHAPRGHFDGRHDMGDMYHLGIAVRGSHPATCVHVHAYGARVCVCAR